MKKILGLMLLGICSSCAPIAGFAPASGVSAFSITSGIANQLDSDSEELLAKRIKEEIMAELKHGTEKKKR